MAENKHTINELKIMQAYPLWLKVEKTKRRIQEWGEYWGLQNVAVGFSGGKDSTVLLHICREMYPEIEAVYIDTGLEYPEIKAFVKTFDNVTILRPKMNFRQVIEKYGYPIISKEVAQCIPQAKKALESNDSRERDIYRVRLLNNEVRTKDGKLSQFNIPQWKPLLNVRFNISHLCCDIMKKRPAKSTKKYMFTGQMAGESHLRQTMWLKNGCNGFNMKKPISNPMSFWTEQDVLHYIKDNNLPIASVYGDIIDCDGEIAGQENFFGLLGLQETLCTTGCDRTGCMFCLFGMHLEKGETRIQRLHRTHPRIYEYIMGGGEFNEQGLWIPNAKGLGLKFVMDEVNRVMGKEIYRY